ncbi:hypothetical protein F5B22DRAFT_651137 [Xylaria bambusicola]|uniref:uncharacterized protein n=1 Tax=Xylaria bambusicola TaxID=326684 RepID=UPI00200849D4|nr:uncharacterized protein F5B22DRAFT_651137 [Xylaria bambusicola]KAI0506088.1 hypothetical protein F5B22DRAFT_651137 [Xylaria bambusicola]
MPRVLNLAALCLLSLAPPASAAYLKVLNLCPFEIYCGGAKNDGTFSPTVQVRSGQLYQSPLPANNDNIGAVLKCALNEQIQGPFQMELNLELGKAWFDLSAVDGDPFLAYHRYAEIDGGLCPLDCPPYTKDCEWPAFQTCMTTNDATMYLCK